MPNRRTSKNISYRAHRRRQRALRKLEFQMKYGGGFFTLSPIVGVLDASGQYSSSLRKSWVLSLAHAANDGEVILVNDAVCKARPSNGELCSMFYLGTVDDAFLVGCVIDGRTYIEHPELPLLQKELGHYG